MGLSATSGQILERSHTKNDHFEKDIRTGLASQRDSSGINPIEGSYSDKSNRVCHNSKVLVTIRYIVRFTTNKLLEETKGIIYNEPFALYSGDRKIDLSELFRSKMVNRTKSINLCLNEGIYKIQKNQDKEVDSELGIIEVEMDNKIISTVKLSEIDYNKGIEVSIRKEEEIEEKLSSVRMLSTAVLEEDEEWEYSDVGQSDNTWSNMINGWVVYSPSSFPIKSTTTTYYRRTVMIPDLSIINSPFLKVKYTDGLIVYVNGKEIFRKNMPLGEITSETKAIKSFDELVESSIAIPQSLIHSLSNYIGIEIHKSESSPKYQIDKFSARIEGNTRGFHTVTGETEVDINLQSDTGKNISFDSEADIFTMTNIWSTRISEYYGEKYPLNFDFTFKNHVAKHFNQAELSGCTFNYRTHPQHIQIYGSVNSENKDWILLYENRNVGLAEESCKNISYFPLASNDKAFESYRLKVIKNQGHDYIGFRMFVVNEKLLPICEMNDGFPSAHVGYTSIAYCGSGYRERKCGENGVWEDAVDHGCTDNYIYLTTEPNQESSHAFDKEIKSLSTVLNGLSYEGTTLKLKSVDDNQFVELIIVIFSDGSTASVYVSILRDEIKCTYGFDSINLFEMDYVLKLKCNIRPAGITTNALPTGLICDFFSGDIAGRVEDSSKEINTTVTLHSNKEFTFSFVWKAGASLTSGLEFVIWKNEKEDGINDDDEFSRRNLKDMWVMYENGGFDVKEPKVIEDVSCLYSYYDCEYDYWTPCLNTAARLRGYIYIAEEGDYILSGISDDRQKFAFGNFDIERYSTTDFKDEKEFSVHLTKGYHIIGCLSWGGEVQNEIHLYYTKVGEEKENINEIIYHGGFLLTHLSYGTSTIVYKEGVNRTILASYEGYPSTWSMNPKIDGLSIRLDGAIVGVPSLCDNQFKSVEISSNGAIDISKTNVQIVCYNNNKENKINGLLVKYFIPSLVNINSFLEPETAFGPKLMLERIEATSIFHTQSEELWNGFPSTMNNIFIADYNGYLNIETAGSYNFKLKCYDYCKLELGTTVFEGVGSGFHEINKTIDLTVQLHKLRIVYRKSGNDNIKQLEFLYDSDGNSSYVSIKEEWLFTNPIYPFTYSSIANNYRVNDVVSIAIMNKNVVLDGFTYSIEPSLPTGLLISPENGNITGTIAVKKEDKTYTITAKRGRSEYYTYVRFEVKEEFFEPEIEYPNGGLVSIINEDFILVPSKAACYTVYLFSPVNNIFIDSNGALRGKAIGSFSGVVTIECRTNKAISIEVNVNIVGCSEGNEFLIFDYLVKSQPGSVILEILNEERLIYSSISEGALIANKVYTFMKCVPKENTVLKITSNTYVAGWYKLYYEYRNMFKYSSLSRDEIIPINLSRTSNKPVLSYESKSFELANEVYYEFYPSIENGGRKFVIENEENLPKGMIFDKKSGLIYGTPAGVSESKAVIISVKHEPDRETSDEITLTFSSGVCKKIFFEVNLYIKDTNDLGFITYKLKEGEKGIDLFDKKVGENKKYFCEDPTIYDLTIGSTGSEVWEYSEMRVQILHNGAVLFRGRNVDGGKESTAKVNTKNLVPFNDQIKYTDEVQQNSNWSEVSFDSSSWNSVNVNELPVFSDGKLVRYYIQSFGFFEPITDLSMLYLSLKFSNGGIRMFMNGVEFYNKYLPKEVTSETWGASHEKSERKYFVTAPITLLQRDGNNVLGIEFHKASIDSTEADEFKILEFHLLSGINSCQFDRYTYYSDENVYSNLPNYNDNEMTKNAFNYMVDVKASWEYSYFYLNFQYSFYPEESRWFNGLQFRTGDIAFHVVEKFEAYGIKTYQTPSPADYIPVFYYPSSTSPKLSVGYHSRYFTLKSNNSMAFNGIRIKVKFGTTGVETGGVYPYSCRSSCFADGIWKSISNGQISKLSCGVDSKAFKSRKCGENGEWEEIDDKICSAECSTTVYGETIIAKPGEFGILQCPTNPNREWKGLCSLVYPPKFTEISDRCVSIIYPESITAQGGKKITITPRISDDPPPLRFIKVSVPNFLSVSYYDGIISGTIPTADLEGKEYEVIINVQPINDTFTIKIIIIEINNNNEFLALVTSLSETVEISKSYVIDMRKWKIPESLSFKTLRSTDNHYTITLKYYPQEDKATDFTLFRSFENQKIENLHIIMESRNGKSYNPPVKASANGLINSLKNCYLYAIRIEINFDIEMTLSEDKTFGILSNTMENMIMIHVGVIYPYNKISVNALDYRSVFGMISGSISNIEGKEVSGIFTEGGEYSFKSTRNNNDHVNYNGLLFGVAKDLIISYSFSDIETYNADIVYGVSQSLTVAYGTSDSSYIKFFRCFALIRKIVNIISRGSSFFGPFICRSDAPIYVDECWNFINFGKLNGTMDVVGFRGNFETNESFGILHLSNSYTNWFFSESTEVGINCIAKYTHQDSIIKNVYVSLAVSSTAVTFSKLYKTGGGQATVKAVYIQRPSKYSIEGMESIVLLNDTSDIKSNPHKYLNGFFLEDSKLYYSTMPRYDENREIMMDEFKTMQNVDISVSYHYNYYYSKYNSIWYRNEISLSPVSKDDLKDSYKLYLLLKKGDETKSVSISENNCISSPKTVKVYSWSSYDSLIKSLSQKVNKENCSVKSYNKYKYNILPDNRKVVLEIVNKDVDIYSVSYTEDHVEENSEFNIIFNLPYPSKLTLSGNKLITKLGAVTEYLPHQYEYKLIMKVGYVENDITENLNICIEAPYYYGEEEKCMVVSVTVRRDPTRPTTPIPTTAAPTTVKPTTVKPSTVKPTTVKPTTVKPTTDKPTTIKPTTDKPTTDKPTTDKPTTIKPTTIKPTTVSPTTEFPSTVIPSTELPHTSTTFETGTIETFETSIPTTPRPIERISIEIKISNITTYSTSELSENDKNIVKDSIIEIYKKENIKLSREDIEIIVNSRKILLRGLENEMNIEVIVKVPEQLTKTEIKKVADNLKEDSEKLGKEIKEQASKSSEETIFKEFEIEITEVKEEIIHPTVPNNNGDKGDDDSNGLPLGVLIGIIGGGVVVLIIIIVGIVLCRSKKTESHPAKIKQKPVVEKGVKHKKGKKNTSLLQRQSHRRRI